MEIQKNVLQAGRPKWSKRDASEFIPSVARMGLGTSLGRIKYKSTTW